MSKKKQPLENQWLLEKTLIYFNVLVLWDFVNLTVITISL